MFVALLGPDGAGKSTLIQNLQESLAKPFEGRSSVFHLRPSVIGGTVEKGPVTNPHGKPPRSALLSLLKILYYALDYCLGYLLKVRPLLVCSSLVLFDRYFDDLLADPRRYRFGGPQWFPRVVRRLIPKPNLFLILDVPEKQLLARKCEVSPEELRRQQHSYRQLAAELPNAVLLDGSLPAVQVARNASEAILDFLQKRHL